ncbi:MAG: bifunctional DNA-formamidopyrimidine glycosylase/DNA-(apurinic or apyrimidinic site) lyase [Bacillota bacterium]|nr:bifunctional DNA-formamidopyrimidine glycosylase/DNA-(apurinic or apyrimidinic site) lyase [Bacillota bacterium]
MPELPEVETVKRTMEMNIGSRVKQVEILRMDILRQKEFEPGELQGQTLTAIHRRGKFLVLHLAGDLFVVVHMGMSGRFYMLSEEAEVKEPHVHFILYLDSQRKLIYQDARRFGGIWLSKDTTKLFAQMGVEPLSDDFTVEYLVRVLLNRKVAIKTLLLNQKMICGLGNIYADEALFEAGIKPNRPAGSLKKREITRLHRSIQVVLSQSIERRGTTFRDYRDGFNLEGENQHYLKVYGRHGSSCPRCGSELERDRIGGRSSHFCPHCQR